MSDTPARIGNPSILNSAIGSVRRNTSAARVTHGSRNNWVPDASPSSHVQNRVLPMPATVSIYGRRYGAIRNKWREIPERRKASATHASNRRAGYAEEIQRVERSVPSQDQCNEIGRRHTWIVGRRVVSRGRELLLREYRDVDGTHDRERK
jgi:hypothetical protein